MPTGDAFFWPQGRRSAERALREEYAAKIAALEARAFADTGGAEKDRLLHEIEAAKKELAEKLRGLAWGLFGRT